MRILVLDAGNTRVTAGLATRAGQWPMPPDGGPGADDRLEPLGSHASDAAPALEAWLQTAAACAPERIVLVSVVPAVTDLVRRALPEVDVVDHTSDLPFASDVADLAAVGPDRLCNVAAARAAGMESALVLDAGTATTFDVLTDGVFRGGVIAPGMGLAARALTAGAARLPEVPLREVPLEAGTDTAAAMAVGAWHAGRGGVASILRGLRAVYDDPPVVVTGGLGDLLSDLGWHDPDWTLRGAAWLSVRPDRRDA